MPPTSGWRIVPLRRYLADPSGSAPG